MNRPPKRLASESSRASDERRTRPRFGDDYDTTHLQGSIVSRTPPAHIPSASFYPPRDFGTDTEDSRVTLEDTAYDTDLDHKDTVEARSLSGNDAEDDNESGIPLQPLSVAAGHVHSNSDGSSGSSSNGSIDEGRCSDGSDDHGNDDDYGDDDDDDPEETPFRVARINDCIQYTYEQNGAGDDCNSTTDFHILVIPHSISVSLRLLRAAVTTGEATLIRSSLQEEVFRIGVRPSIEGFRAGIPTDWSRGMTRAQMKAGPLADEASIRKAEATLKGVDTRKRNEIRKNKNEMTKKQTEIEDKLGEGLRRQEAGERMHDDSTDEEDEEGSLPGSGDTDPGSEGGIDHIESGGGADGGEDTGPESDSGYVEITDTEEGPKSDPSSARSDGSFVINDQELYDDRSSSSESPPRPRPCPRIIAPVPPAESSTESDVIMKNRPGRARVGKPTGVAKSSVDPRDEHPLLGRARAGRTGRGRPIVESSSEVESGLKSEPSGEDNAPVRNLRTRLGRARPIVESSSSEDIPFIWRAVTPGSVVETSLDELSSDSIPLVRDPRYTGSLPPGHRRRQ